MTQGSDPSPPYLFKEGKKENFFIKHWKHWKYGLVRCGNLREFAGIPSFPFFPAGIPARKLIVFEL